MKNLIIIGNGFDLAHGLKTSYGNFIEHLFDKYLKENRDNIFFKCLSQSIFSDYQDLLAKYSRSEGAIRFENDFLKKIFRKKNNWCDIESLYFESLLECKSYSFVKKLNDDFFQIRKELEEYLIKAESSFCAINSYDSFFKTLTKDDIILNFNYTNTVKRYLTEDFENIIHIHGELNNIDNPIIFGYAANHEDSRKLVEKGDNEYMRYIKKHLYKRTNAENNLKILLSSLNKYNKLDVLLLGHSCGISDNLIINQICNNDFVNSIMIFYYENYENFFHPQVNLDRIMVDDNNFEKLINYEISTRMPQKDDTQEQHNTFILNIEKMKIRQEGLILRMANEQMIDYQIKN